MAWSERQAAAVDIEVRERSDLAMVAVQGPNARDKALGLIAEDDRARAGKLGKFAGIEAKAADGASLFVARTGYTGEDGFEIVLPQDRAVALWDALLAAGVKPAGLGARDTLRSEEHTSELQSLMRISYAVFCLKKKNREKYRKEDNSTNNKIMLRTYEE